MSLSVVPILTNLPQFSPLVLEDEKTSLEQFSANLSEEPEKYQVPKGIAKENISLPLEGINAIYPLDDLLLASHLNFFKNATGIRDSAALKSHIMEIRDEAYKRFPYPCIWGFEFLKGKTLAHPFYPHIKNSIKLQGVTQEIFLDLGTFMGIDLRQVILDGWKSENVLGVDIHREWNTLGCRLFRDGDSAPPFFLGDIFKRTILDASIPTEKVPAVLDLRTLKDLNKLKGRVSFICANQLFHLFPENDQRVLAQRCALLLSNKPGSAIFGTQLGAPEEGLEPYLLYLHSPKSWKKLWTGIFGDQVKVTVDLEEAEPNHCYLDFNGVKRLFWLHWSVARI